MSSSKRSQLQHMYRAAIARVFHTTEWEPDDDLQECLREALEARTKEDIQEWFDRWPKEDDDEKI